MKKNYTSPFILPIQKYKWQKQKSLFRLSALLFSLGFSIAVTTIFAAALYKKINNTLTLAKLAIPLSGCIIGGIVVMLLASAFTFCIARLIYTKSPKAIRDIEIPTLPRASRKWDPYTGVLSCTSPEGRLLHTKVLRWLSQNTEYAGTPAFNETEYFLETLPEEPTQNTVSTSLEDANPYPMAQTQYYIKP